MQVSSAFEGVAGKAMQESEKNYSGNVDGSRQQKEPGKSIEQAAALVNNEEVRAEDNVYTETSTKHLVENEMESYTEDTGKNKKNATEIEKVSGFFAH